MSERFKVTKAEDSGSVFPNYGATTGIEGDDIQGKRGATPPS